MSALKIDRDWRTSVTHLKGNVQILIRETVQAGNRFLLIRADEASFNAKSGEIIPLGSVRITEEER